MLKAWGDALYVYIEAMDNDQGNAEIFKTYLTNPVLNGAGYDDLLKRLDRWTNIQAAQVILPSLTLDVRKAVMTEVKLGVVAWSVSERCIALTLRTRLLIYRLLKTQSGLNATRAQNLPLRGISWHRR